jgi:hypothetical protein
MRPNEYDMHLMKEPRDTSRGQAKSPSAPDPWDFGFEGNINPSGWQLGFYI